jgi:segregation and condensation protein B
MTPELENIVESIIFASPEGASTKEIARCVRGAVVTAREANAENAPEAITRFADVVEPQVVAAIAHLNAIYEETGRAFCLVERPAGWRIMSRPEFSPWVRELFPDKKPARLTPSALETLAIIAYRQPMTKSSIEAVRGVSVDGPISALMDRNVIRIAGRADLPGRPLLYETTDVFLEHFGIKTVDELPNASELRSVKLPEPETALQLPAVHPQAELPLGPLDSEASASSGDLPAKGRKKGKGKKATTSVESPESICPASPESVVENLPAQTDASDPDPSFEWSPSEDGPALAENEDPAEAQEISPDFPEAHDPEPERQQNMENGSDVGTEYAAAGTTENAREPAFPSDPGQPSGEHPLQV